MSSQSQPLPQPASLFDMAADGAIAQADIDARLRHHYGPIDSTEFSAPTPDDPALDAPVQVRFHRRDGDPVDAAGHRIALIERGTWHWLTAATADVTVAELHQPVPVSQAVELAARTLCAHRPLVFAPHDDGRSSVVVVDPGTLPAPAEPTRVTVARGLAELPAAADSRRALTSWARLIGWPLTDTPEEVTLGPELRVAFDNNRPVAITPGPTLATVADDAAVIALEHQLLFESRFPAATVTLEPAEEDGQVATLTGTGGGQAHASALLIGVVEEDTFTWAWADKDVRTPGAEAIREQGIAMAIPAFFQPHHPAHQAQRLVQAAMPVLGFWTQARVELDQRREGLVLLDSPLLRLEAPTDAAVEATLARMNAIRVRDPKRALSSYAGFRHLPMRVEGDNVSLLLPSQRAVNIEAR